MMHFQFSLKASKGVGFLVCFCLLTWSASIAAQQLELKADNENRSDLEQKQREYSSTGTSTENISDTHTSSDKEVVEDESNSKRDLEFEALKARVRALEEKAAVDEEEVADLKMRLDMQEENDVVRMTEKERELKVYGFMDVQFSKFFYPKDGLLDGLVPKSTSFALGHWNMFLEKPLNEHFRVLGEVRFLFQPLGEEADGWMGSGNFERANTKATDWLDAYYFNWGGIAIQRAFIEYKLNDYFGVKVGHYLTPYGIWNENHASTVVISAHRPYLNTTRYLPEAQTGLYFFGRAFAGDKVSMDYGFTVSNGRGPTVEVYDLDENKGLGLSYRLAYDGPVKIGAGTYLYMGDCTDTERSLAPPTQGVDFVETVTLEYKEKVFSLHLQFEWKGLLIQGEYVRSLIEYQNGHRPSVDYGIGREYAPDHVEQGAYALLGYMLPFEKVQLRPYLFYEYMDPPDWSGYPYGHTYGGGLNWRIIPAVVWKLEYYRVNIDETENIPTNDLSVLVTQLAVSY